MKIIVEFKNEKAKAQFIAKGNKADTAYSSMVAEQVSNGAQAENVGDFYVLDAVNAKSGMNFFVQSFDFKYFKITKM